MLIKKIIKKNTFLYQNSIMENNTIVFCGKQHCCIIDPSFDSEKIFNEYKNISKIIVILTHSHYDHVGDFRFIEKYASEILISVKAKNLIDYLEKNIEKRSLFFGLNGKLKSKKIVFINDEDELYKIKFYLTPGHSIDSMCLVTNDLIITGDHLFIYDIGRTDLYSSDNIMMNQSLKKIKKIIENNCNKILIPGHGDYEWSKKVLDKNNFLQKK